LPTDGTSARVIITSKLPSPDWRALLHNSCMKLGGNSVLFVGYHFTDIRQKDIRPEFESKAPWWPLMCHTARDHSTSSQLMHSTSYTTTICAHSHLHGSCLPSTLDLRRLQNVALEEEQHLHGHSLLHLTFLNQQHNSK
jgi:hypothetical protein